LAVAAAARLARGGKVAALQERLAAVLRLRLLGRGTLPVPRGLLCAAAAKAAEAGDAAKAAAKAAPAPQCSCSAGAKAAGAKVVAPKAAKAAKAAPAAAAGLLLCAVDCTRRLSRGRRRLLRLGAAARWPANGAARTTRED
jgi:hypothetical protein